MARPELPHDQGDLFRAAAEAWRPPSAQEQSHGDRETLDHERLAALGDEDVLLWLERSLEPGRPMATRLALIEEAGRRRLAAARPSLMLMIRLLSAIDRAGPTPEVALAIAALGLIDARGACPELGSLLLKGEYSPATWRAILELHRTAGVRPAAELLARAFALGDRGAAAAAARLAGIGQMRGFLGTLRALLDGPSPEGRAAAAVALGLLGDRSVKAFLESALSQASSPFDRDLLDALGRIGDRETIVLVRKLLRRSPGEDDAVALLGVAAEIGGPLALRLMGETAASSPWPAVRAAAVELLSERP